MNKTKLPLYEIVTLIIGEILLSLVICAVYLLIKKFDYTVVTGALLGSAVTVFNFIYLSVTTTRAFDKAVAEIGDNAMSDEEAEAFAAENQGKIQNAIKLSYIIRTVTMLIALVVAFVLKYFDVIATLIPLVAFRPIITVCALIKRKVVKNGF